MPEQRRRRRVAGQVEAAVWTDGRGLDRLVAGAADVAAIRQDRIDDERVRGIVGLGAEPERARVEQDVAAAYRRAHAVDVLVHDRRALHERSGLQRDHGLAVLIDRDRRLIVEAQAEGVEPCAWLHEDVVLEQAIVAVHPDVDAGIRVDHADAAEQAGVADPLRLIAPDQVVDAAAQRILEAHRRVGVRAEQTHREVGIGDRRRATIRSCPCRTRRLSAWRRARPSAMRSRHSSGVIASVIPGTRARARTSAAAWPAFCSKASGSCTDVGAGDGDVAVLSAVTPPPRHRATPTTRARLLRMDMDLRSGATKARRPPTGHWEGVGSVTL